MHKKDDKVLRFVYIVALIAEEIDKLLMELKDFLKLRKSVRYMVVMEFLVYYLYRFNKNVILWLGEEESKELMNKAILVLHKELMNFANKELKKKIDDLTVSNLEGCFNQLLRKEAFADLLKLYNEREKEYSQYMTYDEYKRATQEGKAVEMSLAFSFCMKIIKLMDVDRKSPDFGEKILVLSERFVISPNYLKELLLRKQPLW